MFVDTPLILHNSNTFVLRITALFYSKCAYLCVQVHIYTHTAVVQHYMELAAELSWHYEMCYQPLIGSGIVPVQQSGKV